MALKGKVGAETEIQSSASKFFNLVVTQLHQVQNMIDEVHQTKLNKGDWHGVGSHSVNLSTGLLFQVVHCKEHIEEIDHANKTVLFNLFDGYASKRYKMLKTKLKVVEKGEGAIAKWTNKYEKLHEGIPPPQDHLDYLIKATKDYNGLWTIESKNLLLLSFILMVLASRYQI
ncbi:MLP-like protein 43 [Senna tora]|uniref:MLP-like protein 43 n=1 Tax=Senna tora TaxID=362788 RepID=A0A834SQ54_9FABA|nr:MLP-like protein 43 [Senna tora]